MLDLTDLHLTVDEFGRTIYSFPVHIRVLLGITLLFLLVIITLMAVILSSRVYKTKREKLYRRLQKKYQPVFRQLLFTEDLNDDITSHFEARDLKNKYRRSVLMQEIIHLHENFTGETSVRLEEIFAELGLHHDSMLKLRNKKWYVVAKGMRELALMNVREAYNSISTFINSKNEILRTEARIAMMKLSDNEPFSFLSKETEPLTDWDTANIYSMMSKMPDSAIPDFSIWLNSPNKDVVMFCIRMIGTFRQHESESVLIHLLNSNDERIKVAVIRALRELNAAAAEPALIDIYPLESVEVKNEILKALEVIGTRKSASLLEKIIHQPLDHYPTVIQAIRTLMSLGEYGEQSVEKIFENAGSQLQLIIRHARDKRL